VSPTFGASWRGGPGGTAARFLSVAVAAAVVASSLALLASVQGGASGTSLGASAALAGGPSVHPTLPNPFVTGMASSLVLGQSGFTTKGTGDAADQLGTNVSGLSFGPEGTLWVADGGNNRVLEFVPPFASGMNASLVIGQAAFGTNGAGTSAATLSRPNGTAWDSHGDLWVSDPGNNRVLEFVPPFKDGMSASLVLGQTGFTGDGAGNASSQLSDPTGLTFDAQGDLWVADSYNDRVVEFVPPFRSGMNASLVLGQPAFGSSGCSVATESGLCLPDDMAIGPTGALWVADLGHDRTVEFLPPFKDGMNASVVLGENNFNVTNELLPLGQYSPAGVAVDAAGNLWVGDRGVNRVTEYAPGFSINESPEVVIGQSSFSSSSCGTTATTDCRAGSLAFDRAGNLWVADPGNDRILEFTPEGYPWTFSESGLASGTKWSVDVGGTTYASTTSSIVVDVPNGTHAFSVGSVSGYRATPGSGTGAMNASALATDVTFSPTILGLDPGAFALLVLDVILAAAGAAVVVFLHRRGRKRSGTPPPLKPSPAVPPSTLTTPPVPPGASG
jgi:sugar lactone lactonase YvrE